MALSVSEEEQLQIAMTTHRITIAADEVRGVGVAYALAKKNHAAVTTVAAAYRIFVRESEKFRQAVVESAGEKVARSILEDGLRDAND